MIGREGPGPERPGPDYPPEWDREPAEDVIEEAREENAAAAFEASGGQYGAPSPDPWQRTPEHVLEAGDCADVRARTVFPRLRVSCPACHPPEPPF